MTPEIRLEVTLAQQRFAGAQSELLRLLERPVVGMLSRKAIRVESAAKQIATGPPGSQPGEGPGVVTGRLRASITWRLGVDAEGPYADVGTAVFYGPFLELGTRFMAPRPFLRPALESVRE